jgi:alpha-L-arabinofuranosidase
MWGEMFFNRSFEKYIRYRDNNKKWFDLWYDEKDESKGYETDWRKFDWYHTGYEHNAWFAAPGEEGPFHIDDNSTFLIEKSPMNKVEIELIEGGVHGNHFLRIRNRERAGRGGLGQQGKYFRQGASYRFRGKLRNVANADIATVQFYREGEWEQPLFSKQLTGIGADFTEQEWTFHNPDFQGRATFVLWIPVGSTLEVDDFSLMPTDTIGGWRKEVVELAQRVNPKVIRWPGGCFASFYDWRDGVGPYSLRKPKPSYFWGGINYNDVGTAEFVSLARACGADSMVCINMFHPQKQIYDQAFVALGRYRKHDYDLPEITDREKGVRLAADWVAYCNAPVTHPMGKLRAEHGFPQPFAIKYWELDNETYRWFDDEEYIEWTIRYSQAMKAVDPTIKLGLCTYGGYEENLAHILEQTGEHVDFLADRSYDEEGLLYKLRIMRDYNERHGRNIKYCNTEWLATDTKPNHFNQVQYRNGVTKSYMFSKWKYAMNIFLRHMLWHRYADDIDFVNFNNFANTHSQCVIDTPKEGGYLSAAGKAYELISRTPAAWTLAIADYEPKDTDVFQVQAYKTLDDRGLVLYVFNMTEEAREVDFDLSDTGAYTAVKVTSMHADDLFAMNTMSEPEMIRTQTGEEAKSISGKYSVSVPKYSFTEVVLS